MISIVIPTYNGRSILKESLPAVLGAADGKAEIILVDDASNDGTAGWVKGNYPQIKVLRNERNLRFGGSCNKGVKEAKGEIVFLLNNDVRPEKNFLDPIKDDFEDKNVFAVGCREKNVEGNKELYGGRGVSEFRRGLMVHWRPTDQESRRVMWLSGGSMAVRRDLWLKIGGFDRLFRPAYEEDRDVCWQALKAGYKLVFEPRSVVNHIHETTNRVVFGERNIRVYSMKNQLLFVWKNISDCKLLIRHLMWLLYHLTVTSFKTQGVFLTAFLIALIQLPEALISRFKSAKYWRKSDEEILRMV